MMSAVYKTDMIVVVCAGSTNDSGLSGHFQRHLAAGCLPNSFFGGSASSG